jgi:hypothetical protein
MADKPTTADGYRSEFVVLVRATCLYIATKLGDLMDDLVIVGGLAPSLLVDQESLSDGAQAHVGTIDLDVGLTLALLNEGRYRILSERLRRAGFVQDVNEEGRPTRQRWVFESPEKVTIDFLIQPSLKTDRGGALRNIEEDFAAIIAPGLHLAFQDRERITLTGRTIAREKAERDVWVCGPGAFVVLKALAFESRGENKDAYDLYYILRNYGSKVADVATRFRPLAADRSSSTALNILRKDFLEPDAVGPRRVAAFLTGGSDDNIQADVVGFTAEFLRCFEEG